MTTGVWRYAGIRIEHPSGRERAVNPEATSKVSLSLWTPADRGRDVELSEDDLVRLIFQASQALVRLRKVTV